MLGSGVACLALLTLLSVGAPLFTPYRPNEQIDVVGGQLRPPGTVLAAVHLTTGAWLLADHLERTAEGLEIERRGERRRLAASEVVNLTPTGVSDRRVYLLGSDRFGRDVLTRMLYGGRVSLGVGALAVALALTLGTAVGALAGAAGPLLDAVIMRIVDALLAFPSLFLLIAVAALFRPSGALVAVVLGFTAWMGVSRLVRAEIVGLSRRDFVLGARALGQRPVAILLRHLLPNALTPVLVQTPLLIGSVILAESGLSFLGLGIQPPTASWGSMLSEGREIGLSAWWLAVFPGALLAFAVLTFNLIGDGLRDRLDPRLAGARRRGAEAADTAEVQPPVEQEAGA